MGDYARVADDECFEAFRHVNGGGHGQVQSIAALAALRPCCYLSEFVQGTRGSRRATSVPSQSCSHWLTH